MSIFKNEISVEDLVKISSSGAIQVATYPEIRDMLIKLNKNIYGNDIAVDLASPDGQYLNEIALIITRMCELTEFAFKQFDPSSAKGSALDTLASFSHLTRQEKTSSLAQLYVKNISNSTQTPDSIYFIDKAGKTWEWLNDTVNPLSWASNEVKLITQVKCLEPGKIDAPGTNLDGISEIPFSNSDRGWISQLVESGIFDVYQLDDAEVGEERESDEDFRRRVINRSSTNSVSVLSGLQSSIMDISGVKDCYIVNNDTANEIQSSDTTKIGSHCIYIVVREKEYAKTPKETLGKLIYNKLTPGVITTPYGYRNSFSNGINESYEVTGNHKIYYKLAQPYDISGTNAGYSTTGADIVIYGKYYAGYDLPTILTEHLPSIETEKKIAQAILNYLNNITLANDYIECPVLSSEIQKLATSKEGYPSFLITQSGAYESNVLNYVKVSLHNGYLDYHMSDIYFTYAYGTDMVIYVKQPFNLNKVAVIGTTTTTATVTDRKQYNSYTVESSNPNIYTATISGPTSSGNNNIYTITINYVGLGLDTSCAIKVTGRNTTNGESYSRIIACSSTAIQTPNPISSPEDEEGEEETLVQPVTPSINTEAV